MPPSIRPLALALTLALTGAAGVVSAAPAAGQDPQASPPPRHGAERGARRGPPPARQQEAPRPARDQSHRDEHPRRHADDQLSDSVRRVERRTRGRVLSAESMPYEGRSVSRIKVIDDTGRVRVIVDDPQAASSKPRTRRDDD